MRKALISALLLPLALGTLAQGAELSTQAQKNSYSLGFQIGSGLSNDLSSQDVSLDNDALLLGMRSALEGTKPTLSTEEMSAAMMDIQKQVQEGQQKKVGNASQANLDEGIAFLAENKKKDGVKETASGLQYRVITEGSGKTPASSDSVSVHYKGTLIDGTKFDSSYDRGQPATFGVGGVIAGWTEALQLMKEGAKYKLFIPSELAYGERGAGQKIGPNATLIFEVELISVQ